MKNKRLALTQKPVDTFESDLVVYFAFHQKDSPPLCDPTVQAQVENAFALNDFTGKTTDQLLFYPTPADSPKKTGGKRILVLGLETEEAQKTFPDFWTPCASGAETLPKPAKNQDHHPGGLPAANSGCAPG